MTSNRNATWRRVVLCVLLCTGMASQAARAACPGDCNGDAQVTVDEVLTAVSIALGNAGVNACVAVDANLDSAVTVDEIINAVNVALNGCTAPVNSPTPSATLTPMVTATPIPPGPLISFFGITAADNHVPTPSATDPAGDPIYARPAGAGFFIVVEAAPGGSGSPPGTSNFNSDPGDPIRRPDIQIEANKDLGNGSVAICDQAGPQAVQTPGGVPAVPTPNFDPQSQTIANTLNDLGCRFDLHTKNDACTIPDPQSDAFDFVNRASTVQFCTAAVVGNEWHFHSGDTLVTVRWRDMAGNLSDAKRMVIRVP